MSYRLVYTDSAEENLREIAIRIGQDNIDFAISYIEKIRDEASNLTEFPDMGTVPRFLPARKRGIRILIIDNYILQYIPDHKAKTITVIKISYGTQSYKKMFKLI